MHVREPIAIVPARMNRQLARKNIRAALVVGALSLFMLGLTFIVAAVYVS